MNYKMIGIPKGIVLVVLIASLGLLGVSKLDIVGIMTFAESSVTLDLSSCTSSTSCNVSKCNNLGCNSINCVQTITGLHTRTNCLTNNGVQLTSCNPPPSSGNRLFCTHGGTTGIVKPSF